MSWSNYKRLISLIFSEKNQDHSRSAFPAPAATHFLNSDVKPTVRNSGLVGSSIVFPFFAALAGSGRNSGFIFTPLDDGDFTVQAW